MKKLLYWSIMTIAIALFVSCTSAPQEAASTEAKTFANVDEMVADVETRIEELSIEEFRALYDGTEPFVLIDVREGNEFVSGYIPSAINMPRGVLEFRIASEPVWDKEGMYVPEKNEMIVLYCKKGHRGALATEALMKMGYTNVKNVHGGFLAWNEAYPEDVEKIEVEGMTMEAGAAEDSGGC